MRDRVGGQVPVGDGSIGVARLPGVGVALAQFAAAGLLDWADRGVLGALNPEERATLHCLLMLAAGGQLPPNACTPTEPA